MSLFSSLPNTWRNLDCLTARNDMVAVLAKVKTWDQEANRSVFHTAFSKKGLLVGQEPKAVFASNSLRACAETKKAKSYIGHEVSCISYIRVVRLVGNTIHNQKYIPISKKLES